MRYEDLIQIDLSKGKITEVDYIGSVIYGCCHKKRERVFELNLNGEYYGTIKMPCEELNKGYMADILRTAAYIRFPGMVKHPASNFTITNPQPWTIMGSKSMSAERDFVHINTH